jgi:alpha/beta superfamily hydrolase
MQPEPPEIVEEAVRFACQGLALEGVLTYPAAGSPRGAVLLLAPHPHMGGRMDNNVVRHLTRRAAEEGCASLRFNYRGVGESQIALPPGTSVFDHFAALERERRYELLLPDAAAAWDLLVEAAGRPLRRVVVGYSLGAILAPMLAPEARPTHLVALSPPVAKVPLAAWHDCPLPALFVAGDRDFAFDRERFQSELARLPGSPAFVELAGGDHFWRREEERPWAAMRAFVTGG